MKKVIITSAIIFAAIIAGIIVMTMKPWENSDGEYKVGLILIGEKDDKSYNQSHYDGLSKTAGELNITALLRENIPTDESCCGTIEELIEDGCKVIICNSFAYGEFIEKMAPEYPDVYFFHATGVGSGRNFASFFGRMYQMRYLSGIAAGLRTETNEIGYIAAFDIPEVNRGINAFTLGVRSVNPDAKVYVDWCGSWTDEEAAAQSFKDLTENHRIDVMAMHSDARSPLELAEETGIWSIGYNFDNSADYPKSYLTAAIWQWEKFYTPKISECMNNIFVGKHYWESSDTGMVALAPLTANNAPEAAAIIEAEAARLNNGTYDVFYGPITDNQGNIRVAEGESMSDEVLLNSFDWYVEGVEINE